MNFTILTDNDTKITQPHSIKVELMNHQKTMINKMLEIESSGSIKISNYSIKSFSNMINITGNEAEILTNVAILGDKVGSGKTLMIISLLTIKKIINDRVIEMGGNQFYSLKLKPSSPLLKINLIIVPHKILPQWKESFEKFSSTLKVYPISYNRDIDKIINTKKEIVHISKNKEIIYENEEIIKEKIEQYDVILIGETMYKRFYKICKNYRFNRIFIDEADTIKLPREMTCQFNFLWLITGTPKGLLYSNKSFISKIFNNNDLNINSYFVIKNDDAFIEQSIKLPHPKRLKIKCLTPKELNIIKDLIPSSILQMINAGNTEQAIKALNCNVDTDENILQVITKKLVDNILTIKIELEDEIKKQYPLNLLNYQEKQIKNIEDQIKKLNTKYENIKQKIYQLNDTNCPVCMSEFTNPVVVSCCNNTFCFDCLAVSLGELKNNKCPYCKQAITTHQIHVFQSDTIIKNDSSNIPLTLPNKYDIKDKLNVLIDLIQNKPNGRFMIFAGFFETFQKIETKLKQLSIPFYELKGHSSTIKKHINDFKDKKVNVLMLNAKNYGAGMNLQIATDIIIYHRFTKEMEEQIIGRAQRLGRSINEPLNVYYLLHDNESRDIEDKFKFEDQNDIHYIDWLEQEKNNENQIQIDEEKIYTIDMENPYYDNYEIEPNSENKPNSENDIKLNTNTNKYSKKIFIKDCENIVNVKKINKLDDDKFNDNLEIYDNDDNDNFDNFDNIDFNNFDIEQFEKIF